MRPVRRRDPLEVRVRVRVRVMVMVRVRVRVRVRVCRPRSGVMWNSEKRVTDWGR